MNIDQQTIGSLLMIAGGGMGLYMLWQWLAPQLRSFIESRSSAATPNHADLCAAEIGRTTSAALTLADQYEQAGCAESAACMRRDIGQLMMGIHSKHTQ